jgi:hypothetical protein
MSPSAGKLIHSYLILDVAVHVSCFFGKESDIGWELFEEYLEISHDYYIQNFF